MPWWNRRRASASAAVTGNAFLPMPSIAGAPLFASRSPSLKVLHDSMSSSSGAKLARVMRRSD